MRRDLREFDKKVATARTMPPSMRVPADQYANDVEYIVARLREAETKLARIQALCSEPDWSDEVGDCVNLAALNDALGGP